MNTRNLMLTALGCGVMLGMLTAEITPTTMKPAPEQPWRKHLEAAQAVQPASYRFVESNPIDLDPGSSAPGHHPEYRAMHDMPRIEAQHAAYAVEEAQFTPIGFDELEVSKPEPLPSAAAPAQAVSSARLATLGSPAPSRESADKAAAAAQETARDVLELIY